MTFKVIITHPSVEDDEHTYYGISFLNPGKVKSGRLKYSASDNKLKVTLTYDVNSIKVGEKFLAILVPVNTKNEEVKNEYSKALSNVIQAEKALCHFAEVLK